MSEEGSTPQPAAAQPPTCRRCGVRLALAPLGIAQPSPDWVNWMNGVALCQSCILRRLQQDD